MSAKPETAPYRAAFAPTGALADKRREAFARFEEIGFPTRRDEAWRFTDLRPLQSARFSTAIKPAGKADIARHLFAGETHRVVLVNGRFSPELSKIGVLPQGAVLGSTAEIAASDGALAARLLDQTDLAGGQAFASLNAAMFGDGFVLALDAALTLDKPVEIIHLGDAADSAFHLRNLIRLGA